MLKKEISLKGCLTLTPANMHMKVNTYSPRQKSMRMRTSHTSPAPTAVMQESRKPTMFLWPARSRCTSVQEVKMQQMHANRGNIKMHTDISFLNSAGQVRSKWLMCFCDRQYTHSVYVCNTLTLLLPGVHFPNQSTHHDLDFTLTHTQVMLIVDVHPLEGTANALVSAHQEHDSETPCHQTTPLNSPSPIHSLL